MATKCTKTKINQTDMRRDGVIESRVEEGLEEMMKSPKSKGPQGVQSRFFSFVMRLTTQLRTPFAWVVIAIPLYLFVTGLWGVLTWEPAVTPAMFDSCTTADCELKIPKIIHQTYKTKQLPKEWASTPMLWNETHPEWSYQYWDDDRNRNFIKKNFPWFLEQFDAYPNGIQRADSVRYFILLTYGGVYADMDITPVRNIEPMLGDAELVMPVTPNIGLTNAFMAAVPGNAFMKLLTESLTSYANRWYHISRHWQIITSTGPAFVWHVASTYKGPMLRIPASVWGKCKICDKACPVVPGGYLKHLHGDSWHSWDSYLFNYVIFCHQYIMFALLTTVIVLVGQKQNTRAWAAANMELVITAFFLLIFSAMFFS
eukprot:m.3870 g.3870  ORF g.3870 m.3870 type:complete len:371 (+) comp3756_c0_seq1:16-1128(+)